MTRNGRSFDRRKIRKISSDGSAPKGNRHVMTRKQHGICSKEIRQKTKEVEREERFGGEWI